MQMSISVYLIMGDIGVDFDYSTHRQCSLHTSSTFALEYLDIAPGKSSQVIDRSAMYTALRPLYIPLFDPLFRAFRHLSARSVTSLSRSVQRLALRNRARIHSM